MTLTVAAVGLLVISGCAAPHEKVLREYPGEVLEVVPISKRVEARGAAHIKVVSLPTWNNPRLTIAVQRNEYWVVQELERRQCLQEVRKVTVEDTSSQEYEARRAMVPILWPLISIDKATTYNKALKEAMDTGHDSYAKSTETVDGGHRATVTTITKVASKTIDRRLPERVEVIGLRPWGACPVTITVKGDPGRRQSVKTGESGQAVMDIGRIARASRADPLVLLVCAGGGADMATESVTVDEFAAEGIRTGKEIDGSSGPPNGSPRTSAAIECENRSYMPGESIGLTVKVTNNGGGDVYRLKGTCSRTGSQQEVQLRFGRLSSGASAAREFSLELDKNAARGPMLIKVKFTDENGHAPAGIYRRIWIADAK